MGGPGHVYVLHNCDLRDGLVKIGLTTRTVDVRAKELYGTGVPGPFTVLFSWPVDDAAAVEAAAHETLDEYRWNDRREFFMVSAERAIASVLAAAGVPAPLPAAPRPMGVSIMAGLHAQYGPLLRRGITDVLVEHGGFATSLVQRLDAPGSRTTVRQDLDFIDGADGPYFDAAADAAAAAALFLNLDPYTVVMTTELLSERGARLVADLHERAGLEDGALGAALADAVRRVSGPDGVEAELRRAHGVPATTLGAARITEHAGGFLLAAGPGGAAHDLRVTGGTWGSDGERPSSQAVVTVASVDELGPFDSVEVARRDSPRTWPDGGPELTVSGRTASGIPFKETFTFEP